MLATLLSVSSVAAFSRFFVIIFENTDYNTTITTPYFQHLATQGRLLTNMHGVVHPSQPNYIAMVAGSTMGVLDDDNYDLDGKSIADSIESVGMTWASYAQDFPGSCSPVNMTGGPGDRLYARKHNAFMSFNNIRNNATRCSNLKTADQLDADIASNTLPNYVIFVPNQNNDGHDGEAGRFAVSNNWFMNFFPKYLNDPRLADTLFLITYDENDAYTPIITKERAVENVDNHIYSLLIGSGIEKGTVDNTRYNHYSQLALLERHWCLPSLGRNDTTATPFMISGTHKPCAGKVSYGNAPAMTTSTTAATAVSVYSSSLKASAYSLGLVLLMMTL